MVEMKDQKEKKEQKDKGTVINNTKYKFQDSKFSYILEIIMKNYKLYHVGEN